jgi:multicomponent Na+:H+ antiporter subunit E
MALNNDWALAQALIGLFLGFGLLAAATPLFRTETYIRRVSYGVLFAASFGKTFLMANYAMAKAVMTVPVTDMSPTILTYDTSELRPFEVAFLAQCITLTPGTTTIDVAEDRSELVIHAFNGSDVRAIRESITRELTRPMLRFTR